MRDVKIPGALWTLLIAAVIVGIETYVPTAYQMYSEAAVVAILAAAKAANLGTADIDQLLAILRQMQARGASVPETAMARGAKPEVIQEPNKAMRFLLG